MSGAKTFIFIFLASLIKNDALSVSPLSALKSEVVNSIG